MNGLYRTGENLLESIELALNFRKNRKKQPISILEEEKNS